MIKRKVCVITGSRSEYGLFFPILKKISKDKDLKLQLIVTSSHNSKEFGNTRKIIEKDGFKIDKKINNLSLSSNRTYIVKSAANASYMLSDTFIKLKPDLILILGDRYETHSAAITALLMNIPIAHIHGGEITEGAVDEQIRHSITKMSYLHFCSTETYRKRIIQMGEEPSRVFNSGAPGIDNIKNMKMMKKSELEKELNWKLGSKNILFTYHPTTLKDKKIGNEIKSILNSLSKFDFHILFTYANADYGGNVINKHLEIFCKRNVNKYKVVKTLGQFVYLSCMKNFDLIVGNSSSGIIEAASFKKPVVNIGDRQKGRLRSLNIIDCEIKSLEKTINHALSKSFRLKIKKVKNIYGSGKTADFIVKKIKNAKLSVIKKFKDY